MCTGYLICMREFENGILYNWCEELAYCNFRKKPWGGKFMRALHSLYDTHNQPTFTALLILLERRRQRM